jgi:hypothetical protein
MPVAYTDLFNEALDDLKTKLETITGLQVVTDPRNLVPPCAFIGACSFEAWNYNIVKISWPVQIISMGPSNLDAMRNLLNLSALVLTGVGSVTAGRPTTLDVGGVMLPCYELTVMQQAQTA